MQKSNTNFSKYAGWSVAVILAGILIYNIFQSKKSNTEFSGEKEQLEQQIDRIKSSLAKKEKILEFIRDKDIITVKLTGQNASPTAYAKVYWDKKTKNIYLDAKGLPSPPKGKVYQVWSIKVTPLTQTSLGTLDSFSADADKIFNIDNPNKSEAFSITLEPTGGSENPNLEQLYVLGAIRN